MKVEVSHQELSVWMAMDYIDQHISEDLSLDVLARKVGYSTAYFVRVFQQETGETPGEFVRRIRLERSANYLCQEKHAQLLDVALSCGFQSAAVFSRAFRDSFEMSPSQWRAGAQWRRCHNEKCWRKSCGNCCSGIEDFGYIPELQQLEKHPFTRGMPTSIDYDEIEIVDLPPTRVAYLRGFNASKIGGWLPLWTRFSKWFPSFLEEADQPPRAVMHFLDNATICSRHQTRVDIGLILASQRQPKDIPQKSLEGGLYALVPFEGNWAEAMLENEYIWLTLFEVIGYAFDIHRPHLKFFDLNKKLLGIDNLENYEAVIAIPIRRKNDLHKNSGYFNNQS